MKGEELFELLQKDDNDEVVREYIAGGRRMGAKYLQRMGAPGHYRYIYAPKSATKLSRKAKFYYSRFLRRAKGFLKSLSVAYDATSVNVRPKTWKTALVDIQSRNGMSTIMHVDLKAHGIYSYKSRRGQFGSSAKLSRAKKKGILRFR